MTSETTDATEANRTRLTARLSPLAAFLRRAVLDLVVVGAWVGFLTVVFLDSGDPRWAFYTLLFLGVLSYTMATGR